MNWQNLLSELHQRRVFRALGVYFIAAWAVIQVTDVVFPRLGLPDWIITSVTGAAAAGVPFVILLAWSVDVPRTHRRRGVVALTIAVVLVFAGVSMAARTWRTRVATNYKPIAATFMQVTADPGAEWFPSLSPDGKWIVYSGQTSGNRDVYLLSVGGHNPINLTSDTPAEDDHPAFSPDGERIAFRSSRDGGGIFIMGRTGEGVRRVTRFGFKPTWSSDGARIAFAKENVELNPQNADNISELWVADVATGKANMIFRGDAVTPSWSPHGQRIAFTKRLEPGQASNIWTIAPDGTTPRAVTTHLSTEWNPAWSPDGKYLYFASDRSGSMNLWRVAIDESSGERLGEPQSITTPATSLAHISLSADGRRIAYSSTLITSNVQRLRFNPEATKPIGEPEWLTSGTRRWSSPDPSPQGEKVVFYSLIQPNGHVVLMNADGSGLRELTSDTATDRVPRWSPDGNWIAFFSSRGGGPLHVWKIRPDGSELQQLTHGAAPFSVGVWSTDGSKMATSSVQANEGKTVIFDPNRPWDQQTVTALPTPDSTVLPFGANSWSPDDQWLAGSVGFSDAGISVYSFRTRTYKRLTRFGQWPVWLPDSRHILFVSGGKAFYVVDRETGVTQKVYSAGRDVIGPAQMTFDRRTMYFIRRVTDADVWLVNLH